MDKTTTFNMLDNMEKGIVKKIVSARLHNSDKLFFLKVCAIDCCTNNAFNHTTEAKVQNKCNQLFNFKKIGKSKHKVSLHKMVKLLFKSADSLINT